MFQKIPISFEICQLHNHDIGTLKPITERDGQSISFPSLNNVNWSRYEQLYLDLDHRGPPVVTLSSNTPHHQIRGLHLVLRVDGSCEQHLCQNRAGFLLLPFCSNILLCTWHFSFPLKSCELHWYCEWSEYTIPNCEHHIRNWYINFVWLIALTTCSTRQ